MADKRIHAVIFGTVQGVYFRAYAQAEGKKLGLHGWIKNRADGAVESAFEGPAENVDKMLEWLKAGSPGSKVTKVEAKEERIYGETGEYNIRY
ncbi:MAG: acylphosphatase [Proteobacteria bacterium]|nr:acylphosphatase [Pseudomonadota bacterium]MBU1687841.1 acylphosphatase [Pseudomonadota bacterium]